MSRLASRSVLLLGAVLCAVGASAGKDAPDGTGPAGATPRDNAAGESGIRLQEAPGRELTMARCLTCHSLDYITMNAPVMDAAAWKKTVQKMRERFGAPLTDEEADQVLAYLNGSYAERR